jgi:hypothetical protein
VSDRGEPVACDEIRQQLTELRAQKRELESVIDNLQGAGLAAAEENLKNIEADIAAAEVDLANCVEPTAPEENMDTIGYVGTVEVETAGTARLWFGLTESKDSGDWIKIGPVRAWFTMNLEAADRPFFLAELPLLMEAMRSGLQVKASHGGAASFNHWDPNDSFEVEGVRVLRAPMHF